MESKYPYYGMRGCTLVLFSSPNTGMVIIGDSVLLKGFYSKHLQEDKFSIADVEIKAKKKKT